jgi:3',5'-nucleoside bisphosphate phosphatase
VSKSNSVSDWQTPDPSGYVDLHMHTTASDGSESPRRLFELAQAKGIKAIGFCDHDSIGSVPEGLALAEEFGIEFVPGCEIGIAHDPKRGLVEADIVAYYYDPKHAEFNAVLKRLRDAKNKKLSAQLELLADVGYTLPEEEILAIAQGETVRRPHIYEVMKRYFPDMAPDTFYPNTDFGGPWYVSKEFSLALEDCVSIVAKAGGLCVLSSPGSYNELYKKGGTLIDPGVDRLIELVAAAGVRGLETIYSYNHNKPFYKSDSDTIDADALCELITHYESVAERLGLVKTGGCDYHGTSKPQIQVGELAVPARYHADLKTALGIS